MNKNTERQEIIDYAQMFKHAVMAVVIICVTLFAKHICDEYIKQKEQSAQKKSPVITEKVLAEQLYGIAELSTQEYLYTEFWRKQYPADVKKPKIDYIFVADGSVKYGIKDAKNITFSVNEIAKTITIKIPPAQLLSNEIVDDTFVTIPVRTPIVGDKNEIPSESTAKQNIKNAAFQQAIKRGIEEKANENACILIKGMAEKINPDYKVICEIDNSLEVEIITTPQ